MLEYGGTRAGRRRRARVPAPLRQQPVGIDAQVAGARVGLAPVAALHRDPARAVDRDVEGRPVVCTEPMLASQPAPPVVA
jgi:hypothetical protein